MPADDRTRGQRLFEDIIELHPTLDPQQRVLLEEAGRITDRLDSLDRRISEGDDTALTEARQQQNVLKQLLVSLRLPDQAGRKPQLRAARGSYSKPAGKVSSMDRARSRRSAG